MAGPGQRGRQLMALGEPLESMTDLEEFIKAGNDVLLEHMRPSRKVHLMPRAYSPPKLPPPPRALSVDGTWPESFDKSIDKALNSAWADSTIKSYSHSIKVFLNFCKKYRIPAEQTFPSSDYLVCAFIAEQLETVSQSTIKNYVSAIRAWHIRNGYAFSRSTVSISLPVPAVPSQTKIHPGHQSLLKCY